jgi:hypothetical protein
MRNLEMPIQIPVSLNCGCVNSTWNVTALYRGKKIEGYVNDMQFRTPDIVSLNSFFVASRKRLELLRLRMNDPDIE